MNVGTAQQYARWIGVLYIVTIVAGGWGESHVPNTLLIANDVAGTAQRVAASLGLFRASFAAYLLEAACDITLNVLLYALLRPVSRNLALLARVSGLWRRRFMLQEKCFTLPPRYRLWMPMLRGSFRRRPRRRSPIFASHLRVRQRDFRRIYGIAAMVRGYLILRSVLAPRTWRVIYLGGRRLYRQNILVVAVPQ